MSRTPRDVRTNAAAVAIVFLATIGIPAAAGNAAVADARVPSDGNLWIKRGGRMSNHGAANFVGPGHVFLRNDNTGRLNVYAYREDPGTGITQYFAFNKDRPDASVEILGHSRAGDEFRVHGGTVIVGVDSVIQPGRNAVPFVSAQATLALMDGARFGKWCNQISDCDMELRGTLQGGLPERPLARDALFGLAYHNHNGTDFYQGHTGAPTHGMTIWHSRWSNCEPGQSISERRDWQLLQ